MAIYKEAGADAAGAYDDEFRQIIQNDPDIQNVIQRVWGTGPRPSDTPKNLEKANDAASKEIARILQSKGITLPDRTFVNPRSGALEGHRGWSGLSGLQKAAIIAAAAGTGIAGAGALGALGGAGATVGATPGVTAGLGGLGTIGTTVPVAGGSSMGLGSVLGAIGKGVAKNFGGDLVQKLLSSQGLTGLGRGAGAIGQTQASNRGAQLEAMLAADEMRLAADRERRADEAGILKQSQIAEYIKGGGFQGGGPGTSVSGKPFGKFDFGARPSTEAEKDMAGVLGDQLMTRLINPIKLSDYESKMNPGKVETTMNWLGPILSGLGAAKYENTSPLQQLLGKLTTQPTVPGQTMPGQATPNPVVPPVPETTFQPATPRPAGNAWQNVLF